MRRAAMKTPRHFFLWILAALFLTLTSSVQAWDTKEFKHEGEDEPYENWRSLWLCAGNVNIGRATSCDRNEHEWLADRALNLATGNNNPWAIATPTDLRVIDLNSSFYRPDLVSGTSGNQYQRQPSSWSGPLEERDLASPPHFAGIADFTYTIYDWINKNRLCPAISSGVLEHCHNYSVWMGAGFNSSHFGSQAVLSYRQLHATALWAAGNANRLRTALEAQDQATQDVFRDNIREAELMALAYEGAAQHFLQDRWSTGPMWERWSAGDHRQNPYSNDIGQSAVVGAVSGVIHGSEAVLHQPAMLSSPMPSVGLLGINGVNPAAWRGRANDELFAGVGDYRAQDMFDGYIGANYGAYGSTDWPLEVRTQSNRMMQCSAASYRQVIEAFGTNANGGYGIEGVRLSSYASGGMDGNCFETWATNRSIYQAWNLLNVSSTLTANALPMLVRSRLASTARIDSSEVTLDTEVDRAALSRISSRVFWNGIFRRNGIELATGGMGDYGEAHPGAYYGAPDYLEPVDLSGLPDQDARGRDAETIHGFFNRAFAGEFCQDRSQFFEELRVRIRSTSTSDEERLRLRGVCRYLAQRMFAETYPDYRGNQRSYQVAPDTAQSARSTVPLTPVCSWAGNVSTGPTDDTLPYYLHPGYVQRQNASSTNMDSWGDVFGEWGYAQGSVAHWCDSTPVIDTMEEGAPADDVVATIGDAERRIELYGKNFGAGRGRVLLGDNLSNAVVVADLVRWYDERITFTLGEQLNDVAFDDNDMVQIWVEREADQANFPGFRSVGRFHLLNEIPKPEIISVRISTPSPEEEYYSFLEVEVDDEEDILNRELGEEAPIEAFRPIHPGPVRIELEFDMPIDPDAEGTSISLAGQEIEGEWRTNRRWRGDLEVPEGEEFRSQYLGVRSLSVNVQAADGGWIDGVSSTPGPQPDENHVVFFDLVPMHVSQVQVRAGRREIYNAQWSGGIDLDEHENLSASVVQDAGPERQLQVETAQAAPATGTGRIRIQLARRAIEPPVVQVGNAAVEMEDRGDDGVDWTGNFEFEEAQQGAVDGDIPISITARDDAHKGLDADPRTVAYLYPLANSGERWGAYEETRGGPRQSYFGGADNWHRLGEPPKLSMVIVLDASGSMGEVDRMANAQDGIRDTLDNLPQDMSIELAGVVFYNCGNVSTQPFTKNVASVRDFLLGAQPSGATPLAEAIGVAQELFAASANPGSQDWRYVTFTDGAETCDGDVAGAMQDLEQMLADHRRAQLGRQPTPPAQQPPPRPALPQVVCNPGSWNGYLVEVDGNGVGFDTIALVEYRFSERTMADGSCRARLIRELRYVHYGSIRNRSGGPTRSDWDINSNISDSNVDVGWSRISEADLNRVRGLANATRGQTVTLPVARGQIDPAVTTALQEQEGS